ncbi:hypothetical protein M3649_03565 [Ureibacillus chungkukjangi]|uniref:hypothetical protein n=1 Tax=Ureibacillus chungkukjangi TaxID=1202712 RepID=UPI00203AC69A|nr:hypothetical protein [Ureibacillus chungkukjangi]MCM3387208.1 hypothetical protein [Ureibacillus chungkukjangi]
MANIEHMRVVTGFNVNVNPREYKIILEAITEYIDVLSEERNRLHHEEDVDFEVEVFNDKYITEVCKLLKDLEEGYEGHTIVG